MEERAGEGEGVCVRESGRGSVWKREREGVCVRERVGEGVCVRESGRGECVRESERGSVCERERERECVEERVRKQKVYIDLCTLGTLLYTYILCPNLLSYCFLCVCVLGRLQLVCHFVLMGEWPLPAVTPLATVTKQLRGMYVWAQCVYIQSAIFIEQVCTSIWKCVYVCLSQCIHSSRAGLDSNCRPNCMPMCSMCLNSLLLWFELFSVYYEPP